ncbi:MAG: hypothetical protein ACE5JM_12210, partial [Armatimonadota bacterium]
ALSMVSFLLYGRARACGVPRATARGAVMEIWVAAVAVLAALTIATRVVPAARLVPWGVLNADARGQAIAVVTGVFCIAAAIFALSRARTLMNAGEPPRLGAEESGDSSEDVDS